jgi:transmembrane sensor
MSDKGNVAQFPGPRQIEAEACAWISQFDGAEPSQEDLAAFREWINRSPQHLKEIRRLSTLWGDLNILTEVAALPKKSPAQASKSTGRRTRFAAIAVSMSAMVMVAAVVFSVLRRNGVDRSTVQVLYSTSVGEQKSIVLPDHSKVLLNTASRIQVDYRVGQRGVHLLQGEAFFEVAHDTHRPFLVYAGANIVRAVGTAFTVRVQKQDVEVTVTEGVVELSSVPHAVGSTVGKGLIEPQTKLADIKAGQSAAFNQDVESIQSIKPQEIKRKLSWREGILSFSGEPLEQVVAEVSRYTPVTIVISDPAIRDIRIGGYFKIGETDAMLEALETSFGVRVNRVNDQLIYLAAK